MVDTDFELTAMYDAVARKFAQTIEATFASEASLEERWKEWSSQPLDRTSNWNHILKADLIRAWLSEGPPVKVAPTNKDVELVMRRLVTHSDFNLFTQVYLNLQTLSALGYNTARAEEKFESLKLKWAGKKATPLEAKKAIKNASTDEDLAFNADLSAIKTYKQLQTLGGISLNASFRVSPKGKTPAFADSLNLSSLGILADEFLVTAAGWSILHLSWDQAQPMIAPGDGGTFISEYTLYPFTSSSGGSMLNDVLFSRRVMWWAYNTLKGPLVFIPRLNSILIATTMDANEAAALLTVPSEDEVIVTIGPRIPTQKVEV